MARRAPFPNGFGGCFGTGCLSLDGRPLTGRVNAEPVSAASGSPAAMAAEPVSAAAEPAGWPPGVWGRY